MLLNQPGLVWRREDMGSKQRKGLVVAVSGVGHTEGFGSSEDGGPERPTFPLMGESATQKGCRFNHSKGKGNFFAISKSREKKEDSQEPP